MLNNDFSFKSFIMSLQTHPMLNCAYIKYALFGLVPGKQKPGLCHHYPLYICTSHPKLIQSHSTSSTSLGVKHKPFLKLKPPLTQIRY